MHYLSFLAISTMFGGRPAFEAVVPVRVLHRLFRPDDEDLPPNLRAQRQLDEGRIPAIVTYLLTNPTTRILSGFLAVIDGEHGFDPVSDDPLQQHIGTLRISMDATLALLDGQHRLAALIAAVKEDGPEAKALKQEQVSIRFEIDPNLKLAQQWFRDINFETRRPPSSLGVLYDHRSGLAGVARAVAECPWRLRGRIELERATPARSSSKLFGLASLAKACGVLLSVRPKGTTTQEQAETAVGYWQAVGAHMGPWSPSSVAAGFKQDLLSETIAAANVTLLALAYLGRALIADEPDAVKRKARLKALEDVDWSRGNPAWTGRCLIDGKLKASTAAAKLTASHLKTVLGLPLSPEDVALEAERKRLLAGAGGAA